MLPDGLLNVNDIKYFYFTSFPSLFWHAVPALACGNSEYATFLKGKGASKT